MTPTPILFLSDSPNLPSGLARITRDLACHVASLPEFRVGVMGRGGIGSKQLPFAQYNFGPSDEWGQMHLERAWLDFSGGHKGIIFTIWDLARLRWFLRPQAQDNGDDPMLRRFLTSGSFEKWGYIPVDHFSIGQKLTSMNADTIQGYHRIVAYSLWGSRILENTLGKPVDWIPHGYDPKVFQPRDKAAGRAIIGVGEEDFVVGCVMTNQARKDWGLAFSIVAELRDKIPHLMLWAHTDILEREWSLPALAEDFGLQDHLRITLTGQYSSAQLSYMYSACNVTILPSLGEGFGYPIVESLACGIPVLHGNYAAGIDLIPIADWLIEPVANRLETPWNVVRPVYDPRMWAERILKYRAEFQYAAVTELCTQAVEHLQWKNLFTACWKKWFLEGIR